MKRAWAKYVNKPTASILKEYRCYIIPYSEVTHLGAAERGRIRKRCILSVFTPQQQFTFFVNISKRTLEPDVGLFLERVGIKFSKGE